MFNLSYPLLILPFFDELVLTVAGGWTGVAIGLSIWAEDSDVEESTLKATAPAKNHWRQCPISHRLGYWSKHRRDIHHQGAGGLVLKRHHCRPL